MMFFEQKLNYTVNMWFNVVLGSFLKSDHLFNLIILAGYAERSPKYALILKQPFDVTQNLIDNFFFNFDC